MASVPFVPAANASFRAESGSSVAPLIDGVPMFNRLEELLQQARSSFYVGLSFADVENWRHPTTKETFVQWLNRAAGHLDVRVLCWRLEFQNRVLAHGSKGAGWDLSGPTAADLAKMGAKFKLRFDSSGPDHRHCHHEKSWVIDGDTAGPIAVLGGIVLNSKNAVATPGHPVAEAACGQRLHDVNVEVQGLAAGDAARHFVQRWNAAHRHQHPGYHYPAGVAADLPDPPAPKAHPKRVKAQLLRTLRPGQLPSSLGGESSIYEMWRNAIEAAEKSIYIEQQHICHPGLLSCLERACDRGVQVVYVVPSVVLEERLRWSPLWLCSALRCLLRSSAFASCLRATQWLQWRVAPPPPATTLDGTPKAAVSYKESFLEQVPRLAAHRNFCLAGLHAPDGAGRPSSVYVHSKMIIVDDEFALVGSANLVNLSMDKDHTELAVAFWGQEPARTLRDALYAEHAGAAIPSDIYDDPVSALAWLMAAAASNMSASSSSRGLICQLDGQLYGHALFLLSMIFDEIARRGAGKPLSFQ